MKTAHLIIGGVAALALMGGGLGSTVAHVAQGAENVAGIAGGHDSGGSVIPPDVRLTAEAAGGYAIAKGGASRLARPSNQQPTPVPPPTSTTQPPPGPLLHPWAPTITAAPAPAPAPKPAEGCSGWCFELPSIHNLTDNLDRIGRAVIPGGGSSPAPMPAPAPPVPIVVVP